MACVGSSTTKLAPMVAGSMNSSTVSRNAIVASWNVMPWCCASWMHGRYGWGCTSRCWAGGGSGMQASTIKGWASPTSLYKQQGWLKCQIIAEPGLRAVPTSSRLWRKAGGNFLQSQRPELRCAMLSSRFVANTLLPLTHGCCCQNTFIACGPCREAIPIIQSAGA